MREEYLVDLESQKTLLGEINHALVKKNQELLQRYDAPKRLVGIGKPSAGLALLALAVIPAMFFVIPWSTFSEVSYHKSQYLIQNLQGDTIDTWVYWNVMDTERIAVNIVNADLVSDDKIDAIKSAILSTETVTIDDYLLHKAPKGVSSSTYYLGWKGALESSSPTKFPIPQNFVILESPRGEGEITIRLLTERNADGYTGYTKSTIDDGHILRSSIIIYNVDELSADEIGTITRHEFGHALGLGHSTATEDMMAPTVITPYPYISQCNIDAITALYDGKTSSEVICSK